MARNIQYSARYAGWRYAFNFLMIDNISDNPLSNHKNIIIIAPHPDDEIIGCGGAIARASRNGSKVGVIYITNGSHGTATGKADKKMIDIRKNEALAGLIVIGCGIRTKFLGYSDGNFRATKKIALEVIELIKSFSTNQKVVLFSPWAFDDNCDHMEVAKLTKMIVDIGGGKFIREIWQYEVWSPLVPNVILPLGKFAATKERAIEKHKSQLTKINYKKAIIGLNTYRGAINYCNCPAEAFCVLSPKKYKKLIKN